MPAITHGMDIAQVQQLGTQLMARSDEIKSAAGQLQGLLDATPWMGPDSEKFREEWTGTHMAALNQVATALADAGQRAQVHASEQESASNQ
jgi:hypothetical protein